MSDQQDFLDTLENLRFVMSAALEHVQTNRNEFVKNATANQVRQFERSVNQVRTFVELLEEEFNNLEYLVAKRPPRSLPPDRYHLTCEPKR